MMRDNFKVGVLLKDTIYTKRIKATAFHKAKPSNGRIRHILTFSRQDNPPPVLALRGVATRREGVMCHFLIKAA